MSDIARAYAPGAEPGLICGTPAADAVVAGVIAVAGAELGTIANADGSHSYGDLTR